MRGRHTSIHLNTIWCSVIAYWALSERELWCVSSRIRWFPRLADFTGLPRFGSLCRKIFTASTTPHLKTQNLSQCLPNILDEAWTQINSNYLILFIVYLSGTPTWPSSRPLIVCKVRTLKLRRVNLRNALGTLDAFIISLYHFLPLQIIFTFISWD